MTIETFAAITQLPAPKAAQLLAAGKRKKLPRNQNLLFAGQPVKQLFFLEEGLLRAYRIVQGKDVTHYFFPENWFATDYQSYLTGTKGELYVQALTEVSIIGFERADLEVLYARDLDFARLGRILAERSYLMMVARLKDFQTQDLAERYQTLINTNPRLFQLAPQKHIASYLGVAPQSLSRIKAQQ
jgi:CRP-like cAMP-binding protein